MGGPRTPHPPSLSRGDNDCAPSPPPLPERVGSEPPPPPFLLLRRGDVHPHPRPLRVAHANVMSLRMHWHTVAEWQADVVLLSKTRLTAVAQQVMRA